MSENWLALFVSIVAEKSIDRSLRALGIAPTPRFRKLSKLEKRKFLELYKKGLSYSKIATATGRSEHAVRESIKSNDSTLTSVVYLFVPS